jgi:hypothetical protein
MKRCLIVLMAAVLSLCLVSAALAVGPPKTLAFAVGSEASMLLIKSAGTIKTGGGTVKYYIISGTHFQGAVSFPVTGSGYVIPNGPGVLAFHFTYTGLNSFGTTPWYEFHAEGIAFDLSDLTNGGILWGYRDFAGGSPTVFGSGMWTLVNPATMVIPFSTSDPGKMKQK